MLPAPFWLSDWEVWMPAIWIFKCIVHKYEYICVAEYIECLSEK